MGKLASPFSVDRLVEQEAAGSESQARFRVQQCSSKSDDEKGNGDG